MGLLFTTIYYYPPPRTLTHLALTYIVILGPYVPLFKLLALLLNLAKGLLNKIKLAGPTFKPRRNTYEPGIHIYVNVQCVLPYKYLVFTGIMINPTYYWMFEDWTLKKAWKPDQLTIRIPLEQLLWLVSLRSFKEFVRKYNEPKYVTDGVRIFLVQRRTCKKYIQETLCKISRTKFSLGNFAIARAKIAATMARKVMHKTGLILGLAMVATYELSMGKAILAFPIIATRSEVDDDPRTVDFDTYFFSADPIKFRKVVLEF